MRILAAALAFLVATALGHCVSKTDTCYHDGAKDRILPYPSLKPFPISNMNRETCMQLCDTAGYSIAAVENGKQCFCGNKLAVTAEKADTSACNLPCPGNRKEMCGASSLANVLTFSCTTGPKDPTPPPTPAGGRPATPTPAPPPPAPRPPYKSGNLNVLFIASDDMRAELSIYGSSHMHTPNFERLAKMSTVFDRGYIAVSVCMPSRTALLSSRRPDTTRNYELNGAGEYHRNVVNATTVPQWFKEQGYITYGCGKLFHYLPPQVNRPKSYGRTILYMKKHSHMILFLLYDFRRSHTPSMKLHHPDSSAEPCRNTTST